jgi:hypothetical protein
MKLIKTEVNYLLKNEEGVIIASTSTKDGNNKLSKQNCDEIFGVVDVEKLAEESWGDKISSPYHAYVDGFNKAMELNKDKVFSLEDMRKAYEEGYLDEHSFEVVIQSLQQPTEIEVEIEMEDVIQLKKRAGGITNMGKPKLDSQGCLMLKKI